MTGTAHVEVVRGKAGLHTLWSARRCSDDGSDPSTAKRFRWYGAAGEKGAPGDKIARKRHGIRLRLDTTGPIQVQSLMHVAQWSGQHPGWVARKVSCEGHAASSSPPASGSTSQGQWPHACARASGVM